MKKLILVLGAGHCNNEFVSWVLNHSPDTGPRQTYTYTEYHSVWGTHYRAQDEWMLEQYDGVEIVVDSESTSHIQGATLDYKEGLMETGFSIDNPNVSRTCGCGNSFS